MSLTRDQLPVSGGDYPINPAIPEKHHTLLRHGIDNYTAWTPRDGRTGLYGVNQDGMYFTEGGTYDYLTNAHAIRAAHNGTLYTIEYILNWKPLATTHSSWSPA